MRVKMEDMDTLRDTMRVKMENMDTLRETQ